MAMRQWWLICLWGLCAVACGAELRRYEVRPGDTLCQIARRELGDAERWREIASLNGKQDDALREGEIILLPPAARPRPAPAEAPPLTSSAAPSFVPPATSAPPPTAKAPLLSSANQGGGSFWPALAVLAALWLFLALSLRIACWFALVESSLPRCTLLALALSLLAIGGLAAAMAVDDKALSAEALAGRSVLRFSGLMAICLLLGAALTRWLLACRWRSVVTVYAMSLLVASALAIAGWYGLAAAEANGKISPAWRAGLWQLPQAVRAEGYK
ncbi:MAG: LysM peptidoglycan-binding domain-containing protein, partial [Planctomycetota bacterium]|nr:LysM peptidoglycan-binding domain-containing protein [Planctomycetota bacterium]